MSDQNVPSEPGRTPPSPDEEPAAVLDPRIQELIGRSLQAHFDDLSRAPIPDKIMALLAQLEAKEKGGK